MKTAVKDGEHYKRSNLEDAGYYSVDAAEHIRAIVKNAYPFISIDEMKAKLKAEERQIVISNLEITRADLQSGTDDTYELGVYVVLNGSVRPGDDIRINVTATNALGEVTGSTTFQADTRDKYPMTVTARPGDTVTATVSGTQDLDRGVYLYEPQNGREESQVLVGVAEGRTNVRASRQFTFNSDIEQGLRCFLRRQAR